MPRSALLTVMVQAAAKAGRSLVRDFGEVEKLQVSVKGPADFVSAADKRAETTIYEELERARPGYSFLMEEAGAVAGTDGSHRWIVDPLDGTTNFLHGNPNFCISIGLERDGRLTASVIYNPIYDELFTAERGAGAFLNDRRIRVAGRRTLSDALIGVSMPNLGRVERAAAMFHELGALVPKICGFRQSGSAALDLASVAAGRIDGYYQRELEAWDMAAGILLVREAGGFATDFSGDDAMFVSGEIVAGNADIHEALRTVVNGAGRAAMA